MLKNKNIRNKKSIFKWITNHVRPHFRLRGNKKINIKNDPEEIIDNIEDNAEVGIKFKFKF